MPDIATLGLRLDIHGGMADADTFGARLDALATKGEAMATRLKGALVGLAGFEVASTVLRHVVEDTTAAQQADALLEARLRSTGDAAGETFGELSRLAGGLQDVTTYSHSAVEEAEALLLTFGAIKGDMFTRATKDVVELAQSFGGDLSGAAIQVGKALQDPTQGLLALRKAGISFSADESDVIKKLYDAGDAAGAQDLILKRLEASFGGSAEAARNTLGGALKGLENDFGDVFEASRDGSSGVVGFINDVDAGVKHIHDYDAEIKALAIALGVAGVVAAATAARTAILGLEVATDVADAFAAARVAGTGLIGVLWGLVPAAKAAWAAILPSGATIAAALVTLPILAYRHAVEQEGEAAKTAAGDLGTYKDAITGLSAEKAKAAAADVQSALDQVNAHKALLQAEIGALPKAGSADFDVTTTPQQLHTLSGELNSYAQAAALLVPMLDAANARTKTLGGSTGDMDAAVKATLVTRQADIDKQRALNAAFGESDLALKVVGLEYDALAQNKADAIGHTATEVTALNAATDAMLKQNIAAAQLADAHQQLVNGVNNAVGAMQHAQQVMDGDRSLEQQIALLHTVGAAHELLTNDYDAENQAIEAHRSLAGKELADRLALIRALHDQTQAQIELNAAKAGVDAEGAKAAAAVKAQLTATATAMSAEEQASQTMLKDMQRNVETFFTDLASDGIKTFRDFFGAVKDMWVKMLADMAAADIMKSLTPELLGLAGKVGHPITNPNGTVTGPSNIPGLSASHTADLGAGLAGAAIGYGIGTASGNRTEGALGGALGGAAAGFAMGGPVGAIVGGVTGLVSGLFGASKAAKEAALLAQQAQVQYQANLVQVKETVGDATQLDAALAQSAAQFQQLQDDAKKAYKGDALTSQLEELTVLEAKRTAELRDQAALLQQTTTESLQARLLAAEGHTKEAAALQLLADQQNEYAKAVSDGDDPATLALLRQVQAQEALKAATDQATASIDGTVNAVMGYKLMADALAFRYAQPATASPAYAAPSVPTVPPPPSGGQSGGTQNGPANFTFTVPISIDGKEVARKVLKVFQNTAADQLGNSANWSALVTV